MPQMIQVTKSMFPVLVPSLATHILELVKEEEKSTVEDGFAFDNSLIEDEGFIAEQIDTVLDNKDHEVSDEMLNELTRAVIDHIKAQA